MRDFLPEDVRRRAYVLDVVTDVYERYGFEPLETPAVENIETLLGKYGEEGNRLIFKILKRGEHEQTGQADLALRYDLTVPLARVVAEYRGKLPKFFKRYQIQPVWRADRPARGRFREFYQCDVDAIGSTSPVVEAEVLRGGQRRPYAPGLQRLHDPLNHREVLRGLLDGAGVPEALHDTALVAIDKLDKIGGSGVDRRISVARSGPEAAATGPRRVHPLRARRPTKRCWRVCRSRSAATPAARGARRRCATILQLSPDTSAGAHLRLDPSLARGLWYYTGAIFEIAVRRHRQPRRRGALRRPGRDVLRAIGAGVRVLAGLERILVVMAERGMFPPEVTRAGADVLATIWNAEAVADTLALARLLRAGACASRCTPTPTRSASR